MAIRWRILLLLFVARIGLGFQFQTLGSVGDNLVRTLGLDYAEIGTLFGRIGMAPAGVIVDLSGEAMRPDRRAFGMGIFFTIYYAAMASGPPGWIYDSTANAFAPILLAILLFATVIPTSFLFRSAIKCESVVSEEALST